MPRIRTPHGAFAIADRVRSATIQIENRDGKGSAAARIESDFLSVGRPTRRGVVAEASREPHWAAAGRGDAVELRRATVVAAVNQLAAVRRPRRRTLDARRARDAPRRST